MLKIDKPAAFSHTKYINALIYGESGIGKTVLLATAPNILIASAERGLLSIVDKQVDVTEVNTLSDMQDLYSILARKDQPYETLGIDSISEVAQKVLAEYKKVERDPRQAYQKMADEILSIVRKFKKLEVNLVFIAKMERITDEYTGRTYYGPLFPGRVLKNEMPYQLDTVLPMRFIKKEGSTFRVLQSEADIQYNAKDRSGKLARYEEPDLGKLFAKIKETSQLNLEV